MQTGVLALQGGVSEHVEMLQSLGHAPVLVKTPQQLDGVTHLFLPGGESTVMLRLMRLFGLWDALQQRIDTATIACFGTCAGAILLAKLGLDVDVERNAYGAQQASCTVPLQSETIEKMTGTFIRAPRFSRIGSGVTVIATRDGEPVWVQSGGHMALTFHPELGTDTRAHALFLQQETT